MKKIDAPGVYDIPIEDYHGQCCVGPSVSSSVLRQLLHECPAKVWAFSNLNPNRMPREDKAVFAIGRAAHALVLSEPEWDRYFVISPYDNFVTKEARAWRDAEPRTILKPQEFEAVQAMAAAQRSSLQCMRGFKDGKAEQSIIYQHRPTSLWVKTRPDWLPRDPATQFITEYKSCVTIEPRALSNDMFKYGYEMQAAMVLDAVESVLQVRPLGFAHVCQEKTPPYLCELRLFSPEQIEFGRLQYRKALHIFADCLKHKSWPGYTVEPRYFETPYYVAKAMETFDDGTNGTPGYTAVDYLSAG